MGIHEISLDTFGNPEYSNYFLFKRFLWRTRSSNKRWRPQTICSRASIGFIRTNPTKIQIYLQLLLATQITSNTLVGLPTSSTKYCHMGTNLYSSVFLYHCNYLGNHCTETSNLVPYWNLTKRSSQHIMITWLITWYLISSPIIENGRVRKTRVVWLTFWLGTHFNFPNFLLFLRSSFISGFIFYSLCMHNLPRSKSPVQGLASSDLNCLMKRCFRASAFFSCSAS